MSALFESVISDFKEEIKFKTKIKNLIKSGDKLGVAGKAYSEACTAFSSELLCLSDFLSHYEFGNIILDFVQKLRSVAKFIKQMERNNKNVFITPVRNFIEHDYAELELNKQEVERADNEHQLAQQRFQKLLKKIKPDQDKLRVELEEIDRTKTRLESSTQNFNVATKNLSHQKDTKFFRCLYESMQNQYTLYKNCFELFDSYQPKLETFRSYLENKQSQVETIEGHLYLCNNKSRQKVWASVKNGYLICNGKKRQETDLLMCTIKIAADNIQFEVISALQKKLVFQAETEAECGQWVQGLRLHISLAINSQDLPVSQRENVVRDHRLTLPMLRSIQGNDNCADCGRRGPEWVSINLGVILCLECSGVHRSLGTHISKIRSLTLDRLDPEVILFIRSIGNQKFNELMEKNVPNKLERPQDTAESSQLESWIQAKYREKLFLSKCSSDDINKALHETISELPEPQVNLATILNLILQGADVNWVNPLNNKTTLHLAIERNDLALLHILLHHGVEILESALQLAAMKDLHFCLNLILKRMKLGTTPSTLPLSFRKSTLEVAIENDSTNCVKLLQDGDKFFTFLERGSFKVAGFFVQRDKVKNNNEKASDVLSDREDAYDDNEGDNLHNMSDSPSLTREGRSPSLDYFSTTHSSPSSQYTFPNLRADHLKTSPKLGPRTPPAKRHYDNPPPPHYSRSMSIDSATPLIPFESMPGPDKPNSAQKTGAQPPPNRHQKSTRSSMLIEDDTRKSGLRKIFGKKKTDPI
eukprot:TRINITY_DN10667_c0_g1_i1.p1 TRINITY_DN10667_c0_g1~~TRINITY_DN10667_c0_g1_i1.p1  ORF type:complete len:761 (+),score=156.69 TRINITY_DN10667_c0_g1_i1:54-2336(+)